MFAVQGQTKAQKIADIISIRSSNTLNQLITAHELSFNDLWNNKEATPQEILDAYGAQAYRLFVVSSETQKFLARIQIDCKHLVPPYQFTMNPDGTVTIGDKIVEEQQ